MKKTNLSHSFILIAISNFTIMVIIWTLTAFLLYILGIKI
jgi:hypothetical protein